jgi:cob(I)alamin adenosyltransferase
MTTDPSGLPDLTDQAARNRESWDAYSDEYQARHGGQLADDTVLTYLNRLSDLLFILSRAANAGADEPLWKPGGAR